MQMHKCQGMFNTGAYIRDENRSYNSMTKCREASICNKSAAFPKATEHTLFLCGLSVSIRLVAQM